MTDAPQSPKRTRNAAARAAFFSRRDEIEAALKGGRFLREIYDEQQMPGSYAQFCRYVQRYLPSARPGANDALAPTPGPAATPPAPAPAVAAPANPGPRKARPKQAPAWDPANIDKDTLF